MRHPSALSTVLREIGSHVREARQAAGMTQEDAAHAAGIDYKRWQRLEQGSVNPTVKTLERAALALGTTFWNLVAVSSRKRKDARSSPVTGSSRASAPKR